LFLAVLADGGNIETLRQVEINLDGRPLPGPPDGVFELDIYLRPVEDALAGIYLEGNIAALEGLA